MNHPRLEDGERYFMAKMLLDDCQRFQAFSQLHAERLQEEGNIFSYGLTLVLLLDVMDEAKQSTNGQKLMVVALSYS